VIVVRVHDLWDALVQAARLKGAAVASEKREGRQRPAYADGSRRSRCITGPARSAKSIELMERVHQIEGEIRAQRCVPAFATGMPGVAAAGVTTRPTRLGATVTRVEHPLHPVERVVSTRRNITSAR